MYNPMRDVGRMDGQGEEGLDGMNPDNLEKAGQQFLLRIQEEYDGFRREMLLNDRQEIYDSAYRINLFDDIRAVLGSAVHIGRIPKDFLEKEQPIHAVYGQWMRSGHFNRVALGDMVDYMMYSPDKDPTEPHGQEYPGHLEEMDDGMEL